MNATDRVFIMGATFHQCWGLTNTTKRNGNGHVRSVVTGRKMRCGTVQPMGHDWHSARVRFDAAELSAQPCAGCFPELVQS